MKLLAFVVIFAPVFAFGQEPARKLTLAEAIRLAQFNSPELRGARADAGAASAGARAARARTLPQVSVNGFATSGNMESVVSSSPMVDPPAWSHVPTGNFLDGNLTVMAPLLAPRLTAMSRSASWQARMAASDLLESQADLALQVTDAYDRVLLARQMIVAEEAKVASTEELVRTTQAQFDAGKGIEASVQRAQAELARAQRALTSVRNDEFKALLDLEAIIGLDLSSPVDPTDQLASPANLDKLADYIGRAKASRGMVLAAKARVESAYAEVTAAAGQRLPNLYGFVMGDKTDRSDIGGVTTGLTLSFPLFDSGRINAEVSQAKSMRAKAEAQQRQAELTVEKEVRQAWLDVQTARSNALSAEASVQAAQSTYEVMQLRVKAGKSILLEQLDALESFIRAKADFAQALYDQSLAAAQLNRAAGGSL